MKSVVITILVFCHLTYKIQNCINDSHYFQSNTIVLDNDNLEYYKQNMINFENSDSIYFKGDILTDKKEGMQFFVLKTPLQFTKI